MRIEITSQEARSLVNDIKASLKILSTEHGNALLCQEQLHTMGIEIPEALDKRIAYLSDVASGLGKIAIVIPDQVQPEVKPKRKRRRGKKAAAEEAENAGG